MKYTIYTYPLYSHSLYNWCLCDCRERIRAKDLPVEDRVFIMKPDVPSAYAERSKSHMERKDPLQTQFVASRAITVTQSPGYKQLLVPSGHRIIKPLHIHMLYLCWSTKHRQLIFFTMHACKNVNCLIKCHTCIYMKYAEACEFVRQHHVDTVLGISKLYISQTGFDYIPVLNNTLLFVNKYFDEWIRYLKKTICSTLCMVLLM